MYYTCVCVCVHVSSHMHTHTQSPEKRAGCCWAEATALRVPEGWGTVGSHPRAASAGFHSPVGLLRLFLGAYLGSRAQAAVGQNQKAWLEAGRAPGEDAVESRGTGGSSRGEAGQSLPGVGIVSVSEATVSGREGGWQWGSRGQVRRYPSLGRAPTLLLQAGGVAP